MNDSKLNPNIALIVEDDPNVRELAAALLEETELQVVEVESAEAALEKLDELGGRITMVFADVRLAGPMDGVQLAKAVCNLWPSVRIVLTSGYSGARLDGLPERITFIPKPWRGLDVLIEAERAVRQPPDRDPSKDRRPRGSAGREGVSRGA